MTEISRRKAVAITDRVRFGAGSFVVMAGPCAVESRDQLLTAARPVAAAGAAMLRGGVFKPRTSPHSFQGLGEEGLRYLAEASRKELAGDLESGLQVGDKAGFFLVKDVTGPNAGNSLCYR